MTTRSSLHFQIPAGQAPEWLHLTPAGTFSGADGRGPYRVVDAQAVITSSMAAGKLAIDENHAIDKAAPEGRPSPARGWIVAMEVRADGIWGRVEWTGEGKRMADDHAYRGFSPVIVSEKATGKVLRILRGALTNDPNLTLTTLHSRSDDMDFLAKLRQALGLKTDATEDGIITAVTSHAAIAVSLGKIAEAAGLKADATGEQITTHLQAQAKTGDKVEAVKAGLKAAGLDYDTATVEQISTHLKGKGDGNVAELTQTVVTLQSQLTLLQSATSKDKAVAFVDGAIAAGKPIKPLRDHYVTQHQKDPARVETEINAMVSLNAGGIVKPPKAEGGALDAEDLAVVEAMGLDPKKFAETKAGLEKVTG
jgi:phage I-like protein